MVRHSPKKQNSRPEIGKPTPVKTRFRPGMIVARSGIYEAFHAHHRLSHEVSLLAGYAFPPCSRCHENVRFELVKAAPSMNESNTPLVYVIGVFLPEAAA